MSSPPKFQGLRVPTVIIASGGRIPCVHGDDHVAANSLLVTSAHSDAQAVNYYVLPQVERAPNRIWHASADGAYSSERLLGFAADGLEGAGKYLRSSYLSLLQSMYATITGSTVLEDPIHAINVLEWLLKIDPQADMAVRIAAVGHDIDRSIEGLRIYRKDYVSYAAYRSAHMRRSAGIVSAFMRAHGFSQDLMDDVYGLVVNHEYGGTVRGDVLKDADSLSYFDVNLPFYYRKFGNLKTRDRCVWGFAKLSSRAKAHFATIEHKDPELQALIDGVVSNFQTLQAEAGKHL